MPRTIRPAAVLFDYGNTLVNYGTDLNWRALFEAGLERTYQHLSSIHPDSPARERIFRKLRWAFRRALARSWVTRRDFHAGHVMARALERLGVHLPGEQLNQLDGMLYSPAAELARIEPNLRETLLALRARSLKLGIISNTVVPGELLDEHLEQAGVLDLFTARIYTSQTGLRKPSRGIFELALRELGGVPPAEAVFVGDMVHTDVRGALRTGMTAIIKRPDPVRRGRHRPHFHIRRLDELPQLLDQYMGSQPPPAPTP